jgi:G3E family GTPase
LDGIITLVDAKYIESQLSIVKEDGSMNEATRQIALADRIILNKKELVSEKELLMIESSLR